MVALLFYLFLLNRRFRRGRPVPVGDVHFGDLVCFRRLRDRDEPPLLEFVEGLADLIVRQVQHIRHDANQLGRSQLSLAQVVDHDLEEILNRCPLRQVAFRHGPSSTQ